MALALAAALATTAVAPPSQADEARRGARGVVVAADAVAVEAALKPAANRARVVHLWASWCTSCLAELPELARTLKRSGADVLFLSLDGPEGAADAARALAAANAPGLSLRAESGAALAPLRRIDPTWDGALPSTYVLAPDGRVIASERGSTDLAALESAIQQAAPRRANRRGP